MSQSATTSAAAAGSGGTPQRPQRPPLEAAKTPAGPGAVAIVGLLMALLLTGFAVLALHDALAAAGAFGGGEWLTPLLDQAAVVSPAAWMVPAGAALCLLGLWLLAVALKPRPRKAVALDAATGVYLRPRDVATLARTAAEDVDGVITARTSATSRTLDLRVRATSADGLEQKVSEAVESSLEYLSRKPRVRVRVRTEGGDR